MCHGRVKYAVLPWLHRAQVRAGKLLFARTGIGLRYVRRVRVVFSLAT